MMVRQVAFLAATLFLSLVCQKARAESGQEILDATGVRGGLVVHLGCGDGTLTTALRPNDRYLVHGLDNDPVQVEKARDHLQSQGVYGPVSVGLQRGAVLPFVDNVVNLLVSEDVGDVSEEEIQRVLCPGGVAYLQRDGAWRVDKKPWPDEIDEWTHYLHGPDNNAVAHDDAVSSPFHLQWVDGPKWARHHNHLASVSAMVSSRGRIFSIVDEGSIASISLPPKWYLLARDAFNGVELWRRPVGPWEGHLRPFRSGPPELQRRLVAVGDRVYVTLGYKQPLTALDGATGDVLRTYDDTEDTVEVVCHNGMLYVVVGTIDAQEYSEAARRGLASPRPRNKRLLAIRAESGEIAWEKSDQDTSELFPTTTCVDGDRVFFHSLGHVICLNGATGAELWRVARPARGRRLGWSTPTLVVQEDVVLCADCASPASEKEKADASGRVQWSATAQPKRGDASLGHLIAFSADDGQELWRCATAQGYNSPADVFVADGLVWTNTVPNVTKTSFTEGRDPRTGEVRRTLDTAAAYTTTHHHRCYRSKATDRFILLGRAGTELIDLQGEDPLRHNWVRGTCQYGVLPCNGLLYAPPHSCACYIQSKLSGFWALAPRRDEDRSAGSSEPRLTEGPAYDAPLGESPAANSRDWPTYRQNSARSGSTATTVPTPLRRLWQGEAGTGITSPVVADGRLLLASVNEHTVRAMNAADGRHLWSYTAGGRVDSPPTVHAGRVLFGSADGYVYCLRVTDGTLVWKFRAAPADRRTVVFGQVESVWPVTGSVMVREEVVYCTAGRSSYLDGGMVFCRLDPRSGQLLSERRIYHRDAERGEQPEALIEDVEMPGALPDVLSSDGPNIFWRDLRLDAEGAPMEADVPHMYSSVGLLDDTWWHRTYWVFGTRTYGRASGWAVVANYVPSGRLLVLDKTTVFGYGRQRVGGGDRGLNDIPFHLFRADQKVTPLRSARRLKNNNLALTEQFVPTKVNYHWSHDVPLVVRAMVLAGDVLYVAGPAKGEQAGEAEPSFDEVQRSLLVAYSAQDGRELERHALDQQPVFDGLIAAGGQLFLALRDDTVVCFAPAEP